MPRSKPKEFNPRRERLHEVIFEADTPAGKAFDVALLIVIIVSVLIVMLESVDHIKEEYNTLLIVLEWIFTIIFTIEYGLRLYAVYRPWKYAKSFFGIIDLLAIIPTYLSLIVAGTHTLVVIRILRLLRIFRVFKLVSFLKEGTIIMQALKASRPKITVFLVFVLLLVTVMGAVMYTIEGGEDSAFTSIPRSIYWAIVTLTTVGYGDIAPTTEIGQFIAAIVMILGYAVIAVPTGIVSAEFISNDKNKVHTNTQACRYCGEDGHDDDALYCKYCGEKLNL